MIVAHPEAVDTNWRKQIQWRFGPRTWVSYSVLHRIAVGS